MSCQVETQNTVNSWTSLRACDAACVLSCMFPKLQDGETRRKCTVDTFNLVKQRLTWPFSKASLDVQRLGPCFWSWPVAPPAVWPEDEHS